MTSEVRTFATDATDPYERGRELGAGCAQQVHEAFGSYQELWAAFSVVPEEIRAVGTAVLDPIESFSPSLRAELAGLAAGSGLAEWQVGALNARTELLALGDQRLVAAGRQPGDPAECSTLVRLPRDGSPLTAQTWDWHTPLRDSWFVATLRLPGGRTVRTLTEYGIAGKIGVAADGPRGVVGVHFNALRHAADCGDGGVPVHLVARRILDEADTLDAAVKVAAAAEVSASAAVTVTAPAEASGRWEAATIELHPGGPSVQTQREADDGCWLAHTNHFVARGPDADSLSPAASTTVERLDRVSRVAHTHIGSAQAVADALASHDLGPRSVCVHGFPDAPLGLRTATLAVAVAEPAAGRLHVHAGRPCDAHRDTWWSGG